MSTTTSYRQSHTAPEKGRQYDQRFRNFAWRRYLWKQEQRILLDIVRRYLPDRPIRHLDFACGTGRVLGFLRDYVAESTGVDVSESMLAECRRKVPDAEILQADLTRNDVLARRKFDLITAFRFFPNAEPELRREAIEAIAWHLYKDGILVFNNHRNAGSLLFRLARVLGRNISTMSRADSEDLVRGAGFHIDRVYAVGSLPGYDGRPLVLPAVVHQAADWLVNRLNLGPRICQDTIFVCRKNSSLYERVINPAETEPLLQTVGQ